MKWVKASERLPEDKFDLVCIKTDGGGCPHYQTGDLVSIKKEMESYDPSLHAFETEWLDENESWFKEMMEALNGCYKTIGEQYDEIKRLKTYEDIYFMNHPKPQP